MAWKPIKSILRPTCLFTNKDYWAFLLHIVTLYCFILCRGFPKRHSAHVRKVHNW